VGQFDWFPALKDDELLAELAGNRWMRRPRTQSRCLEGHLWLLPRLATCWEQSSYNRLGRSYRVNVFTHANKDLIAFGGHIEKRTVTRADVFLNINGANDSLTAIDPDSMNNLNQPSVTFTFTPKGGKTPTISVEDIQKRFATNAKIVLYACHTGLLQKFVKSIATFFNVEVFGFTVEIAYFPPAQTVAYKFQHARMRIGLVSGGGAVTNWRDLITVPKLVISAKP